MTGLALVAFLVRSGEISGPMDLFTGLLAIICFSFFAWLVGIIILGALPWLILHIIGARMWVYFSLTGAVLAPRPFGLDYNGPNYSFITVFSLIGGVVGWIIWRVAYSPSKAVHPMRAA